MLKLGCTYLIVKDMRKSIEFYEALLEMKVTAKNINRWAQFDIGNCIALFNPEYDSEMIKKGDDLDNHYNEEYLSYIKNNPTKYGNNVVLNFNVSDLNTEYERVRALNIGEVSEIMYINITSPYYCFMIEDPDGNLIEIAGKFPQT